MGLGNSRRDRKKLWNQIYRNRWLYLMMVLPVAYFIIFKFGPIYGLQISFRDFRVRRGIWGSEWVGLKHFRQYLTNPGFWILVKNTILLGIGQVLFVFPIPIIFALLVNEARSKKGQRLIQNISYLPHFVSWVVVGGLVYKILDMDTGAVNSMIRFFGGQPIAFMREPSWFWFVIITVCIWKELGWNTIIYLAALSGIDAEQYEAALVDGANGWHRLIYITIPSILPIVGLMLIMTVGNLINSNGSASFDAVYNLRNALTATSSDTLDYFIFSQGVQHNELSYAAAAGFVQGLVSLCLVMSANAISRKTQGYGAF